MDERVKFASAMREHGLPDRIRTDNGSPFDTTGPLGLSKLLTKWRKLGIAHERIHPGEPPENGRLEQMGPKRIAQSSR